MVKDLSLVSWTLTFHSCFKRSSPEADASQSTLCSNKIMVCCPSRQVCPSSIRIQTGGITLTNISPLTLIQAGTLSHFSELFSSENNAAVAFLVSIWRYYNGLLVLILHFLHQAVPQHRVTPELRGPRRSYVDYFVRPEKNPENFTFTLMPCQLLFKEREHLH